MTFDLIEENPKRCVKLLARLRGRVHFEMVSQNQLHSCPYISLVCIITSLLSSDRTPFLFTHHLTVWSTHLSSLCQPIFLPHVSSHVTSCRNLKNQQSRKKRQDGSERHNRILHRLIESGDNLLYGVRCLKHVNESIVKSRWKEPLVMWAR